MEGCYLIHFENKLHHAVHYLGWSSCLKQRLVAHFAGNSAKLIHAVSLKGIRFSVVRLWIGGESRAGAQIESAEERAALVPYLSTQGSTWLQP